jgi:hypothetical protein
MPAVFVGRLFDLGYFRMLFSLGSAGLVTTTFLIAECNQYWQFLLAQGIMVGVRPVLIPSIVEYPSSSPFAQLVCAACYGQIIGLIGHWFKRRRGLAVCCTALGGPIGGSNFPRCGAAAHPKGRVGNSCIGCFDIIMNQIGSPASLGPCGFLLSSCWVYLECPL